MKKNCKLEYYSQKIMSNDVCVIIDKKVSGYYEGFLRTLPFIVSYEFLNVTYPNSWYQKIKKLTIENHNYFHANNYDDISSKFAVITNKNIEKKYYSVYKLINYSIDKKIPSIYVLNNKNFRFRGELRPFSEEDQIKQSQIIDFNKLYKSFKSSIERKFNFKVSTKVPLHLLESAAMISFIEDKNTFEDEKEIIDDMILAPYLPIWSRFSNMLQNDSVSTFESLLKSIKYQLDLSKNQCEYLLDKIKLEGDDLINKTYNQLRLIPKYEEQVVDFLNFVKKDGKNDSLKSILLRPTNEEFFKRYHEVI